jgi:hypothetical protein
MNIMQALEILKTWINLDATLRSEQVTLNRTSFLLSEMSYGKMYVGENWHHIVPTHRNVDGTVRRDIHAYAEAVATENGYGARELVEMIVRPLDFTKH